MNKRVKRLALFDVVVMIKARILSTLGFRDLFISIFVDRSCTGKFIQVSSSTKPLLANCTLWFLLIIKNYHILISFFFFVCGGRRVLRQ